MAESDGQEKTEQATGKKLFEAREEGKAAKSTEINALAVFGSGLILVYLTKGYIGDKFFEFTTDILGSLNTLELTKAILQTYFLKWMIFFFTLIMPILIGIAVISTVSNISQVGLKITPKALKIKFDKFNLLKGVKRMLFSSRSLVEVAKGLTKLIIIGIFSYVIISDLLTQTAELVNLSIDNTVTFMLDSAFTLIWKITMFYSLIAVVDYLFQRYKFNKDMMMTKQEVKDEMKQTEGDPIVKSRIRRVMLNAAKKRMMKDIPTADVVVTNPTHVAVALKYDMDKEAAPKVVAKGLDDLAQRIKKIAAENNVPLYEDVELARAIYKACEIGDFIPTKLFKAVAQILACMYQMKKVKRMKSIV